MITHKNLNVTAVVLKNFHEMLSLMIVSPARLKIKQRKLTGTAKGADKPSSRRVLTSLRESSILAQSHVPSLVMIKKKNSFQLSTKLFLAIMGASFSMGVVLTSVQISFDYYNTSKRLKELGSETVQMIRFPAF